ncbi:CapA family protein [Streptomyces sp. NPDC046831]|uniref:CapA family protein n=1 Tax=Streptomyces sp. NPDC046831 TaxID=3154805 RepID=UPI0034107E68
MIARRRQAALAVTALLAAAAACQAHNREHDDSAGRPGPSAGGRFTLVATGDVIPDDSVVERAASDARAARGTGATAGAGHDFGPMLAGVEPLVSRADVALCHMETVYGAPGAYSGAPLYKSPPEIARALAATGYDGCSTASEHTLDDGAAGIRRTLDALDRAGVRHAGSARTEAEARGVTLLRAGRAWVAHLSYGYGSNRPLPPGQPWAVGLIDEARIVSEARAARRAGADVVVVSLHWGTDRQEAPDQQQLTLARRLTASRTDGRPDVDLLLGTHAHVPQPYEKVNGTWVVYGMGDQIAGQLTDGRGAPDPRGNQSTLARFTFGPPARPGGRWEVTRAEFFPLLFDPGAGRVVDVRAALTRGARLGDVRDRIRTVVLSRGAAKDGLTAGR